MLATLDRSRPVQSRCCICFSQSCFQSVDHESLSFQSLIGAIQNSKRNEIIIDQTKRSLRVNYQHIKHQFCSKVDQDQKVFQEWLNQFYFTHITERINRSLLCQLAQGNYSQLPTKSLPKLIKVLKRYQQKDVLSNQLPDSFKEAINFLSKMDIDSITQKPLRLLGVERVIKSSSSDLLSLTSKRSLSDIYNPEEYEQFPQIYQWKNVKLNKNSRIAQLSNKNIKDEDVIREIPRISCFKNIRELQIRNNSITPLSCKVIVNNMGYVQCLDIRGNRIGDKGLEYLILGMPHLKSFMISQTGATDKSGRLIAQKMDNLQLFWAEHNQLTGEVILSIGSKPKVKVMSVAGNPVEQRFSSILHGIFVRKGYIVL